MAMAFGAVTILMDTLHQNFLQPTPRFPLRNKTKVTSLYRNLSSLQTSLEQDLGFRAGKYDEVMKGLEAQLRDVSVELRFQIEHHLRLFYLGKSMKLRLHSAQKLLPILNGAIKSIESMDFDSVLKILAKHFLLPVSSMPAHIKKRVKSFCTQHQHFLFEKQYHHDYEEENADEDEQEKSEDDEQDCASRLMLNIKRPVQKHIILPVLRMPSQIKKKIKSFFRWESKAERRAYMLYEAASIIRQEVRAPSYLNKYMKQRIEARQRIRQLFIRGIKLTSYLNKQQLKLKNAYNQSKTSQENNTSLRGLERNNITVGDSSLQHTLESSSSTINMVGCDDEFNTIMDKLSQKSSKREIVSIMGMGGIGKTTLARKIYEDASFISCFDCRAWVTISQEYNPTQVFQCLLRSLTPGASHNNEASKYELAEQVYRLLKHRRYFIIVDDIWNTDVWDDLMRCFQDDNIGSRILLTTRQKNVAEYADSGCNFCHTLRFLDSNESWNLFQNKVCKRMTTMSPEFEKIGREIVEKCKGLPLAITVAAGLLSNSNQTFIHEWEHIAKCVPTLSLDHSNQQGENIIDLSYSFLPHHLKLCFMSFGCFPEDYKVYEGEIVDFWVSEGFLKVLRSSESLEDVARRNLQDLTDRNLVLIYTERPRSYQMHDTLRELALREVKKENMVCFKDSRAGLRWKRNQSINSSSISHQPLSICSYNGITPLTNTSSLIATSSLIFNDRTSIRVGVIAQFKFLRTLKLYYNDRINVDNIFLKIADLVHMRYLEIDCQLNIHNLPLFMLGNLQKLDVSGYSSCEPLDIWGLPQLRILQVEEVGVTVVPPRSVHHNLESIRSLDYRSCTKELFLRIPNLRILHITTNHKIHPNYKAPNWFESLVYLYKLEYIGVEEKYLWKEFRTIRSMGMRSLENFLPNLKKLNFFNTHLKWKDIDVVGMLSKLEVLVLRMNAVKDRKWEPKDGRFRRLKFLQIGGYLQYWEATSDHFPILENLVLFRIYDLKEIPGGFADITTLKSIKLYSCSKSLVSSAKRIQREVQEYGNDTFVVDIIS